MTDHPYKSDGRIAKLEAELAKIQAEEVDLKKGVRLFSWIALGIVVASPLGLLVDGWITFVAALTGIFLFGTSVYLGTLYLRGAEQKRKLIEEKLHEIGALPPAKQ